jgi:predicted alpha/beta hydrolase family esterase
MTAEQRNRISEWLARINRLMELNAPDVILAHSVSCLVTLMFAYLEESLGKEFAKWLVEGARTRAGLCQTCSNEIPARPTYPPVCPDCQTAATGVQ